MQTVTDETFSRAKTRAEARDYNKRYERTAKIVRKADVVGRAIAALEAAYGGGRETAVRMLENLADDR